MQFERAAQVYRETDLATMPVTDYILQLLRECLAVVQQCQTVNGQERNEQVTKAQNILFELMAMTNHEHPSGKRLFQFYVYLNQCLVQVRLHEDKEALQQVVNYLKEMIESWSAVKVQQKRRQGDRI